ncbi:unnamed protein product [Effrenium voratum]|nr:unnamed protein product [Effrenium voratum]
MAEVRVGILSTASIVGKVLPGLKHGMTVVGVASRDHKKAQEFCAEHSCGEGMLYDEMLERSDVDVLYIPLPTGLRNEKILAAIAKGKHIYSEKPMGGTAKELEDLINACASDSTTLRVDTIVACAGTLWFPGNRSAVFDCGCTSPHRSQFEVVCENGLLRVDDLVGGQKRSGNFGAYETPFVGSTEYVQGDAMGKDEVISVEGCDHVNMLVDDFAACVRDIKAGGKPSDDWPKRSLLVHKVMCAVFESANKGGALVPLGSGGYA